MAAVKKHVYEDGRLTIGEMADVLARDFAGDEALRLRLENKTPHYGNDDPYVDGLAKRILSAFDDQVFACNDPQKPDKFVNTLFGYFFHIYHGEITGGYAQRAATRARRSATAWAPPRARTRRAPRRCWARSSPSTTAP